MKISTLKCIRYLSLKLVESIIGCQTTSVGILFDELNRFRRKPRYIVKVCTKREKSQCISGIISLYIYRFFNRLWLFLLLMPEYLGTIMGKHTSGKFYHENLFGGWMMPENFLFTGKFSTLPAQAGIIFNYIAASKVKQAQGASILHLLPSCL